MEETAKSFTPEESLQLIGKFIMNYRKNFRSNSYYFLLWGWLISLASITHFILLSLSHTYKLYDMIGWLSGINWAVFTIAGFVMLFIHIRSHKDMQVTRSHIDKFVSVLWQVSAIAILLGTAVSLNLGVYPSPFILLIAGSATIITGLIIRFNPLVYGGILFFVFSVIASFFNNEYQLLINAAAIILGYIVPGYMLKNAKEE